MQSVLIKQELRQLLTLLQHIDGPNPQAVADRIVELLNSWGVTL